MTLRCYADTLSLLEAELAIIDARRPLIVAGINSLRPLVHLNTLAGPVEAIPAAAAPVSGATAPQAEREPRKSRDTAATMDALDAQIINIVRDTQPAKPNAVAAAVDGKTSIIRARIQLLVKDGRLVADGATSNRVLRLPAPGTTSGGVPSVESSVDLPLAGVAERDAAILTLVKRGPKTFDDLLRGLTTKPADVSADAFRILVKRSLRRLIMRGALVDVGDKFKAVL